MLETHIAQDILIEGLTTLKGEYGTKPNFDYTWQERDYNRRTENQIKVVCDANRIRLVSHTGSEVRIAGHTDAPGVFVVPFWSVYEFIKNLPAITIDVTGKDEFVDINCDRTQSSWRTYPVETFPVNDNVDQRGEAILTMTADWLAAALARVLPFTSKSKNEDSRRNVYFTRGAVGTMLIEATNGVNLIQLESPFYMPKIEGLILDRAAAQAIATIAATSDGTVTFCQNDLKVTVDFQFAVAKFDVVAWPQNYATNEPVYPDWTEMIAKHILGAGVYGSTPPKYHLASLVESSGGAKSVILSNVGLTVNAADGGHITHNAPILWNLEFEYAIPFAQLVQAAKAVSVNDGTKAEAAWEVLNTLWEDSNPEVTRITVNMQNAAVMVERGCVTVYLLQEQSKT